MTDIQPPVAPEAKPEALKHLTALVERQIALTRDVNRLTEQLKNTQATLRDLSEKELPREMLEVGVKQWEVASGGGAELKTSYHAGKLTDPTGLAWVEEHEGEAIIRNDITLSFGAGQEAAARQLLLRISRLRGPLGFKITTERHIHPQTLGAFVREKLAEQQKLPEDERQEIPFDDLGVYSRTYTEVTLPTNEPVRAPQAKRPKQAPKKSAAVTMEERMRE